MLSEKTPQDTQNKSELRQISPENRPIQSTTGSSENTNNGSRNVVTFGLHKGLQGLGLPPFRDVKPTDR